MLFIQDTIEIMFGAMKKDDPVFYLLLLKPLKKNVTFSLILQHLFNM